MRRQSGPTPRHIHASRIRRIPASRGHRKPGVRTRNRRFGAHERRPGAPRIEREIALDTSDST